MMLPYAPVQLLLFQYDDGIEMPEFLVMTSGNTSGAPICRDDQEAEAELLVFVTVCCLDRKIRIRAGDSVMDFYEKETIYDPPFQRVCTASVYGFHTISGAGAGHRWRTQKLFLYWGG